MIKTSLLCVGSVVVAGWSSKILAAFVVSTSCRSSQPASFISVVDGKKRAGSPFDERGRRSADRGCCGG